MYGPKSTVLRLETWMLAKFAERTRFNDPTRGGVGTSQPWLFLYAASNYASPKCRCSNCKQGKKMMTGESSSSEAPQEHWFPPQRNDDAQEKEVLKWTKDAGEK